MENEPKEADSLRMQCDAALREGRIDDLRRLNDRLLESQQTRNLYYYYCSFYLPLEHAISTLIDSLLIDPGFLRAYLRLGELVESSADDRAQLSRRVLPAALTPKWMRSDFSSKAQPTWRHGPDEAPFKLPGRSGAFNKTYPFTGCGAIYPLPGKSCRVDEAIVYCDRHHLYAFDQTGAPFELGDPSDNLPLVWECARRLLSEGRSVLTLDGPVHFVRGAGSRSFYHWMIDIAPQLALAKQLFPKLPIATVCSNAAGLPFQDGMLKLIEPSALHIEIDGPIVIRARRAVLSYFDNQLGRNVPQWTVDLWRNVHQTARAKGLCAKPAVSRVFIVRSLASGRALLPVDGVDAAMRAYGFQPVLLETLSLSEQFDLFAKADIVVSAHGAGLTHTLFMRPGSVLVEIFGEHMTPSFRYLAGRGGVSYVPVSMKSRFDNVEIRTHPERDETRFGNIEVDEEKLQAAIAFAVSLSDRAASSAKAAGRR